MNRDEHIRQLRQLADSDRAEAAGHRADAVLSQRIADGKTVEADRLAALARGWDQIADAIQSGELAFDRQPEPVADDGVLADWERELLARTDTEGLTADEREARSAAWSEEATAEDDALGTEQETKHVEVVASATPRPFGVGDMVNVNNPAGEHNGLRGKIVGFTDYHLDRLSVAVEYDNLGNIRKFPEAELMHHGDFLRLNAPDATTPTPHPAWMRDLLDDCTCDEDPAACASDGVVQPGTGATS